MYWVADSSSIEERWTDTWLGWTNAGRHLHYSAHLRELGDRYLHRVLSGSSDNPNELLSEPTVYDQTHTAVRPFITIHARHNDFPCQDKTSETCFKSATVYLDQIESMRHQLRTEKGVEVGEKDVIVFSVSVRRFPHPARQVQIGWCRTFTELNACCAVHRMRRTRRGGRK